MARDEAPPFERGSTYYNGSTIDSNNIPTHLEGKIWVFEDIDLASTTAGAKPARTNAKVTCMIVRNTSGITLAAKRTVRLQKSGTSFLARVDGYQHFTAGVDQSSDGSIAVNYGPTFVVDEFLTGGAVANDLFWVTIEGPTMVTTPLEGDGGNVINVGDFVVARTAAASTGTTAGRVQGVTNGILRAVTSDVTRAVAIAAMQAPNILGTALSARTTGNTGADLLINMRRQH